MLDTHRPHRRFSKALLVLFLATVTWAGTLLLGSAELQAQSVPLPDTFAETVDVRVVNLEVVVEDEDGNRVHDLRPDDFVLYVDGRAMPVEFFTEVADGRVRQGAELSGLPSAVVASAQEEVGTSYLLFLEETFSPGWSRNRILKNMQEQIDALGPADQMAIVAFNGYRLELLSDWTNSRERLTEVLGQARQRKPSVYLPVRQSFSASFVPRPYELPDGFSATGVFGNGHFMDQEIQETIRGLNRTQTAVESAMRGFSSVPGRKVMLLTAGDWPLYPAEAAMAGGPTVGLGAYAGGEALWSGLYQSANRLGFTLYPIDVGTPSIFFAFNQGNGPEDWWSVIQQTENRTTLYTLAEETGGRAFIKGQAVNALDEIVADTRSYYWLGFTPQWRHNDEYHDIRVEVASEDLRVRHRSGFLDRSRSTEVAALVESSLLTGKVPGGLQLEVELGEPTTSWRKMEVPLSIRIPSDDLVFLLQGEVFWSNLELHMLVVDSSGERVQLPVVPVRVGSHTAPEAGASIWYQTTLEMRRKDHQVIVMLFDPVGGKVLSAVEHLDV